MYGLPRTRYMDVALAMRQSSRRGLASAPGLYAACAATRKGLVSTVRACIKNNIILRAVTTFYHRACGSDVLYTG